ncbi:hypothetical protein E1B25_17845 [Antarcticimicrobium sediminis]|uniref:Sulfotransferase family protein n=2 Tax=Antarcticimicrobium sediminis TaxID=2546227 RepID=A0A4R5ELD5_9RHOB|nr:hypothetical protein E1B25_17845 [Antarcticimicrobium sediminis]
MLVPHNMSEALNPWAGERMVFIHTPKCGGSFVSSAFGLRYKWCPTMRWREASGHLTYRQYKKIFADRGRNLDDNILFTVIRNPWDWHVSWYHYVGRDTGGRHSGMPLEHEQIKDLSFSDYIKWLDDEDPLRSCDDYMRRQISDWILDDRGKIAVSDILRQENLHADLEGLRDRYGLRLNIPPEGARINASHPNEDYRRFYNDVDSERIARRHARDIALFDYSFD